MPIPAFDEDGLLPLGVHLATLEEVRERFGAFQHSNRRPNLYRELEMFFREAQSTGFVEELIVDGSFVTGIAEPNDVDLIVALRGDHDFETVLRPFEYNVISKRSVLRRHGFDILSARVGSETYNEYVEFFQRIRGRDDRKKGILRLLL
jgi:hypothetical protein